MTLGSDPQPCWGRVDAEWIVAKKDYQEAKRKQKERETSANATESADSESFSGRRMVDNEDSRGTSERSTDVTELRLSTETRGLFLARLQSESDSRAGDADCPAREDGCR